MILALLTIATALGAFAAGWAWEARKDRKARNQRP